MPFSSRASETNEIGRYQLFSGPMDIKDDEAGVVGLGIRAQAASDHDAVLQPHLLGDVDAVVGLGLPAEIPGVTDHRRHPAELRAALQIAVTFDFVSKERVDPIDELLDRELAMLYRLERA